MMLAHLMIMKLPLPRRNQICPRDLIKREQCGKDGQNVGLGRESR